MDFVCHAVQRLCHQRSARTCCEACIDTRCAPKEGVECALCCSTLARNAAVPGAAERATCARKPLRHAMHLWTLCALCLVDVPRSPICCVALLSALLFLYFPSFRLSSLFLVFFLSFSRGVPRERILARVLAPTTWSNA